MKGKDGVGQTENPASGWKRVLTLDHTRKVVEGSEKSLCEAIGRGADLRIATRFRHDEHVEPASGLTEWVDEVAEFRVTCLFDRRWTIGFMTLRAPVEPPEGFGPRPSISFFMYNQNGQQAIARPMLDGLPPTDMPGPSPSNDWSAYPKYDEEDTWDIGTRAPSSNFVYAFEHYRFFVHDNWQEVFAHDSKGTPTAGTLDRLVEAFRDGCEVKVGISGLYADLAETDAPPLAHEVFVQIHSGYYGTDRRIFSAGTHPLVRVRPRIPARYETGGWDFGWVMTRSDGFVARWLCHPYTLQFHKSAVTAAIRWFVR